MKRIFYSIFALAVAVITLSGCDDVPMPFNKPNYDPADEPVVVDPTGSGTQEDPFNVAAANSYIAAGGDATVDVYVKGVISLINSVDTNFGNAIYYISDDGKTTSQLEVYRGNYTNGDKFTSEDQIAVGDTVVVCGKLVNYNGTYEFTTGSRVVYQNGKWYISGGGETSGTGTATDPYNVAAALKVVTALSAGAQTDGEIYVKGKVVSFRGNPANDIQGYGNISYYISDDGTAANQILIFQSMYLNGEKFTSEDQLKVGDEVVVCGPFTNYQGNTPETVGRGASRLVSINGTSGGGDTPTTGDGTEANPFSASAAFKYVSGLAADKATEQSFYIKGKVVSFRGTPANDIKTYGNISYYISDDGTATNQFLVFQSFYFNGERFTSEDQLKVGDEVVVVGPLVNYRGNTPETVGRGASHLVSINGATSGSSTGTFEGLSVSFETGQGPFTIDNIQLPEGTSNIWSYDSISNYMKASGYIKRKNTPAQARLVSPAIDFSAAKSATLTFNNAVNFVYADKGNKIEDLVKVQVSTDGKTWEDATVNNYASGNSWTFVDSTVDLSKYAGKKTVYIGFLYISTEAAATTWEIKNVVVK